MKSTIYLEKPVVNSAVAKVGDILVGSCGYEASISQWWEVKKVTGKSVVIQKLSVDRKYTAPGGMEWISTPIPGSASGRTLTKRIVPMDNGSYRVKLESYISLYRGDLTPRHDYNHH